VSTDDPSAHPDPLRESAMVLRAGLALSNLDVAQLWSAYLGMGGTLTLPELVATLQGDREISSYDHNMLAQALNDHFTEHGQNHPVAYAQDSPPTTLRVSIDDGPALYREISADLTSFWGHQDSRALHHPMWLRQFVTNAVIARHDNLLIGYLLGTLANPELAYIHLVATRRGYQRRGVGRRLYDTFLTEAASHGVAMAEAITTPPNPGSVAFHQQLGFAADLVTDYGGSGQDHILFRLDLATRNGEEEST